MTIPKELLIVRNQLQQLPISEGYIPGVEDLYVERYLFQAVEYRVSGLPVTSIICHLSGTKVREGLTENYRSITLPSQSILLPKQVATEWHYSGAVDFIIFYLLSPLGDSVTQDILSNVSTQATTPLVFSDALVNAVAQNIAQELFKTPFVDTNYLSHLAEVLLLKTIRAVSFNSSEPLQHIHISRLARVIKHIKKNIRDNLTIDELARLAEVSPAHFRRIFVQAFGMPPHRYVLQTRLQLALNLLISSSMPLANIANECGFSSQSHFTACFHQEYSATPREYRLRQN